MSIAEEFPPRALRMGARARSDGEAAPARRRGRPPLESREAVLEAIRRLAANGDGLFRVHRRHPGLYARARRMFGAWSAAVALAGLDYPGALQAARQRSLHTRRSLRPGLADRTR